MQPQASLLKVVAAGAGFLAALAALIVLILVTRDPGDPAPSLEPACLDFASQKEAQRFFDSEGGADELDANGDGVACDALAAAAKTVTLDDYVLAQQVSPTVTPTATPTPRPTTTPGPTAVPTPTRSGNLPKTGIQATQMAVAGMSLVTTGMFGVAAFNVRAYAALRRRRREEEKFDLIGW